MARQESKKEEAREIKKWGPKKHAKEERLEKEIGRRRAHAAMKRARRK